MLDTFYSCVPLNWKIKTSTIWLQRSVFEKLTWCWFLCICVLLPATGCQHGGFLWTVPLGVSISAQLRSSGCFLLWAWPAASRRRGRSLLFRPRHRLHQPALLLLQPKPQPSAIHLQTQLGSVLPPTLTHQTHLLHHDALKIQIKAVDDFAYSVHLSKVRQVFSSPSLLSNLQLLDAPCSHSLSSPYNTPASTWSSSPLTKTSLHSHTPTSLYTPSMTSSFTTSRDGYSPSRDGRESPRLQEALKAERMSPLGGSGASSSFLNLTPAAGSVYTPSSHSHPHMLSPYSSYMTGPQEYSSASLYSSPGAWISPSYSPKMRNKMRISTPGENTLRRVIFCDYMLLGP